MPKTKNRGHRETRRPQLELPEVPDLGNLAMPPKGNRAAARYVASVGPLWDRRRADRKARRNALAFSSDAAVEARNQHLDKTVREQMLRAMTGWSFDHASKAFVPTNSASERFEELLDAVIDLGTDPVTLRVSGLTHAQAGRVRRYLDKRSILIAVNRQVEEPALA